MRAPAISVCVVGARRSALDACLASLVAQEAAPAFELLVSLDRNPGAAETVRRHFPQARVCHGDGLHPGAARNDLVQRAQGEWLLFIDDDVTTEPRLLRRLVDLSARHPGTSVFGGPNETPRASSLFQAVQGAVLGSLAGSGPVRRRYGAHHAGTADERWFILCNLAVRREAMLPFPDDLVCAEENAVLWALANAGEEMRYDPSLVVFHERRPTARSFAAQMLKYGRGRGELIRREPDTVRAAYMAPVLLLLYLLALPALIDLGGVAALIPAGLYTLVVGADAIVIGWHFRSLRALTLAGALTILLHVCYGAGILRGLLMGGRTREGATVRWEEDAAQITAAVAGERR